MNKLTQVVKDFWNDEEGLTAVEYAIAGGLVSAAAVAAFSSLGTNVTARINELVSATS